LIDSANGWPSLDLFQPSSEWMISHTYRRCLVSKSRYTQVDVAGKKKELHDIYIELVQLNFYSLKFKIRLITSSRIVPSSGLNLLDAHLAFCPSFRLWLRASTDVVLLTLSSLTESESCKQLP
jgi:hypothetical protein